MGTMSERSTYHKEAAHLAREYDKAVGLALRYGIPLHRSGGLAKSLGDLREEIRAHEKANPS